MLTNDNELVQLHYNSLEKNLVYFILNPSIKASIWVRYKVILGNNDPTWDQLIVVTIIPFVIHYTSNDLSVKLIISGQT